MSTVADLLAMLRRPVPADGKRAAQSAPGIAEIEGAVRRLQAEREDAERRIRAMPELREALIAQPDTDDQIAALERETDRLHLAVERLDRLEGPLFARLNALGDEARRAQWAELRDRYAEAALRYYDEARLQSSRVPARRLGAVVTAVDCRRAR